MNFLDVDAEPLTSPRDPRRDGPWTVYGEMQTPTGLAVVETVVEGETNALREIRDLEDGGFNAACWPTESPDN